MSRKHSMLTETLITHYLLHLREAERSANTISKYAHDLHVLLSYLRGRPLTKEALIEWKKQLIATLAPTSVNSMLAAANGFLQFCGWAELRIKLLKIQKSVFIDEEKELSRNEYERLVRAVKQNENERLALVLQTICATGIRVSELKFITAEAVRCGRAEINNKGKLRIVFLPGKLCRLLTVSGTGGSNRLGSDRLRRLRCIHDVLRPANEPQEQRIAAVKRFVILVLFLVNTRPREKFVQHSHSRETGCAVIG